MKKTIILLLLALIPGVLFANEKVSTLLLNGLGFNQFIAYCILAYVGMFLNILSDIIRRNPDSISSPTAFSLKYWLNDNKARLIRSLITIPVCILFINELSQIGELTFISVSNLGAFIIGLGADHIWEILKRKNIINNAG